MTGVSEQAQLIEAVDSEPSVSLAELAKAARESYEKVFGVHEDFARSIKTILDHCATEQDLGTHSITYRAKTPESFEKKAARPSNSNPQLPRYTDPIAQITDKSGVRVITYFLSTLKPFDNIIHSEFEVTEQIDKIGTDPRQLGYQSIHYLVRLNPTRSSLSEYRRYRDMVAEIQVRTILQHTWAEIEHDVQYKAIAALPTNIQRRFAALAGLIEIADREFQAIQDEDVRLKVEARQHVNLGELDKVEVTGDSLKAYLDKQYGPDGRMSDWSYSWTARVLRDLGFANLAELDSCISGYDDGHLSRILHGNRQGQLTRFEDTLLAAMGKHLVAAHPWYSGEAGDWFLRSAAARLAVLRHSGIQIGDFKPVGYPNKTLSAEDAAILDESKLVPISDSPQP